MLLMGKQRFLSLADFRQMDFSGLDLVVLSACETGLPLGGKDSGETMEGLAGLVQQQGARSVVASLWPVADASSALLMRDFYHHLRDAGISKAEALRQAQLALLHDHPDARHPYYWAPFLMVGDWR